MFYKIRFAKSDLQGFVNLAGQQQRIKMLNKGLRDEESIRIDNVLKRLLSLVFVPKKASKEDKINIENQLNSLLGLNLENLTEINSNDLIERLKGLHLDWNQFEQFSDFLIAFSKENPFDLREKAITVYNHIQTENKTFSFEIFNKIASAKVSINIK